MSSKKHNITERQDKLIGMRKRGAKFSKAELIIANFLKDNGVEFYSEFFFKEMTVKGKAKVLFFDFYMPDLNIAIEFDGEQHYTGKFNGKKMINQATNDFLKSAFCKKKKINLIRIKYTDFENIEKIICEKFDKILG